MVPSTPLPNLSDLSLQQIFSSLPLSQLFDDIPLVHPRWDLVSASLLKTKRQLVLYLGDQVEALFDEPTYDYPFPYATQVLASNGRFAFASLNEASSWEKLSLASLEPATLTRLVHLMPSISNLAIAIHRAPLETIAQVTRLLEHWFASLQTFALIYDPSDNEVESQEPLHRLARAINGLPLLQNLTLDLRHTQFFATPLDLPILRRLKTFNYYLPNYGYGTVVAGKLHRQTRALFDALYQYLSVNDALSTVGLFILAFNDPLLLQRLSDSPFASKVLCLGFGPKFRVGPRVTPNRNLPRPSEAQLRRTPRLQSIEIHLIRPAQDFAWLSGCLMPLTNLQYLSLLYDTQIESYLSVQRTDALLRPLSSVKVLRLRFSCTSHDALHCTAWSSLFPSLQILHLLVGGGIVTRCSCYAPLSHRYGDGSLSSKERNSLLRPCLGQLLKPFCCLASLRKAVVDVSYFMDTRRQGSKRMKTSLFVHSLAFTKDELIRFASEDGPVGQESDE